MSIIGELNKRVTIQYPTKVSDGRGRFDITWNDAATVWAAIWPISAKESIQSDRLFGEITHRIRIRYRRNIRTSWRIKFGDRKFNISGPPINPSEKNKWLDIICKEAT